MDGNHLAAQINNQDPLPGGFQASGFAAFMAICNHFIAKKLFSMAYNTVTMPVTVTVNFINSYSDLFAPSSASAVTQLLDPAPETVTPPFLSGYTDLPPAELYRLALVHTGPTSLFWQTPAEHVQSIKWEIMVDEELVASLLAWIDELKMMAELGMGIDDFDGDLPEASLREHVLEAAGRALDNISDNIFVFDTLLRRHFSKISMMALPPVATYLMRKPLCWTFGYLWHQTVCLWPEFGGMAIKSVALLAAIGILHEIWETLAMTITRYGVAALRMGTATLVWVPNAVHSTVNSILTCAVTFTLIFLAVAALLSCASRIEWYDPHWSPPVVIASPSPTSSDPPSTTTTTPSPDGGSLSRDTSASFAHAVTGSSHETTGGTAKATPSNSEADTVQAVTGSSSKATTSGTAQAVKSKASGLPRRTNTYRAPSMESDSEDEEISSVSSESDGDDCGSGARVTVDNEQTSPSHTSIWARIISDQKLKKRKEALRAVAAGSYDDDDDTSTFVALETNDAQEPASAAQAAIAKEQKTLAFRLWLWDGVSEAFENQIIAPIPAPAPAPVPAPASAPTPAPTPAPVAHIDESDGKSLPEQGPSRAAASPSTSSPTSSATSSAPDMPAPTTPEPSYAAPANEETKEQGHGADKKSDNVNVVISPSKVTHVLHKLFLANGPDAHAMVTEALIDALECVLLAQQANTMGGASIEELVEEVIEKEEVQEEGADEEEAPAPAPFEYPDEQASVKPLLLDLPAPAAPTLEVVTEQPIVENEEKVVVVVQVRTADTSEQTTPVAAADNVGLPVVAVVDAVAETLAVIAAMGPEDDGEVIEGEETEIVQTTTPTATSVLITASAATSATASAPAPGTGPDTMRRPNTWEEILREFPHVPLVFEGINLETRYTDKKRKASRSSLRRWVNNAMKKKEKQSGSAASGTATAPHAPSTSDPAPTSAPSATTAKFTTTTPKIETNSASYAGQELPLPAASAASPTSTPASNRSRLINSFEANKH